MVANVVNGRDRSLHRKDYHRWMG